MLMALAIQGKECIMGQVGAGFTMSLDGFIAGPNDEVDPIFNWYENGDTPYIYPGGMQVKVSAASTQVLDEIIRETGAIVTGRRLFDITNGWGGQHPADVPIFVPEEWIKEHPDAPFTFVTDGVESAIRQAQAVAGDKNVGVAGPNVAQQAIQAGLMDEIGIELVPVLMGKGIRFFEYMGIEPVELEQTSVVVAPNVTHLRYRFHK
jgi:dihydrofolate reductase